MGIHGLGRLIADICPEAIKEAELSSLFGRRVAIDASMQIYQFLIAIRNQNMMMTNESGETTSHLVGLFYRTCKLLEVGIKPVYVFDGRAPELKAGELEKRKIRRTEAENKLEEADVNDVNKFSKRLVRVSRQNNEDCKKLLKLLGLPIIESPGEAEAQCAQLSKEGLTYGAATEDMDGLTFGTPKLIRNLSCGSTDKVKEYNLEKILKGLELTHDQFIDLCILMGCDYCSSIKGIGGKRGLDLIKKYGSIEKILENQYNIHEFIDADVIYDKTRLVEAEIPNLEPENENQDEEDEIKGANGHENGDGKKEAEAEGSATSDNEVKENDDDEDKDQPKSQEMSDNEVEEDNDEEEDQPKTQEMSDNEEIEHGKKKKRKGIKKDDPSAVPENWLFKGARKLFVEPNVLRDTIKESDLRMKDADEEEVIKFLCTEHGFSEERVKSALKRIKISKSKCSQTRIDSFFKTLPSTDTSNKNKIPSKKRPSTGKNSGSKRGRKPK